jgi:hypothetical protein
MATSETLAVTRVDGYISRFSDILDIHGYEVLRLDSTKQNHLDRGKLELLFEVKA